MRIIVAGTRTYTDTQLIYQVLDIALDHSDIVIQGAARGPDRIAAAWARSRGVACLPFPADWERFGSPAGRMRNQQMACAGEALLAFWNGESKGTEHMIAAMRRLGKPVRIFYVTC